MPSASLLLLLFVSLVYSQNDTGYHSFQNIAENKLFYTFEEIWPPLDHRDDDGSRWLLDIYYDIKVINGFCNTFTFAMPKSRFSDHMIGVARGHVYDKIPNTFDRIQILCGYRRECTASYNVTFTVFLLFFKNLLNEDQYRDVGVVTSEGVGLAVGLGWMVALMLLIFSS
jgi:hypothetical protein